jgi:hypothetical protein
MEIKLYRWMLLLLAAGWCCELPSVHVRLSRVVRAMRTGVPLRRSCSRRYVRTAVSKYMS